jgi:hypothetical protein
MVEELTGVNVMPPLNLTWRQISSPTSPAEIQQAKFSKAFPARAARAR